MYAVLIFLHGGLCVHAMGWVVCVWRGRWELSWGVACVAVGIACVGWWVDVGVCGGVVAIAVVVCVGW